MSDYERMTHLPVREVLEKADSVLTTKIDLKRTRESGHGATYSGAEGTLQLDVHRHGVYTVVHASTNQLRTSRLDIVTRYLLDELPYQPHDPVRHR
jgi:hypothetical protein